MCKNCKFPCAHVSGGGGGSDVRIYYWGEPHIDGTSAIFQCMVQQTTLFKRMWCCALPVNLKTRVSKSTPCTRDSRTKKRKKRLRDRARCGAPVNIQLSSLGTSLRPTHNALHFVQYITSRSRSCHYCWARSGSPKEDSLGKFQCSVAVM